MTSIDATFREAVRHRATTFVFVMTAIAAMLLFLPDMFITPAAARCEVAPANGGKSRNCGGRGDAPSSSGSNSGSQALQLGIGLLQQGLASQPDDDMDEWKRQQEEKQRAYKQKRDRETAAARSQAEALEQEAAGAAVANPWATPKKPTPSQQAKRDDGIAPIVDGTKCVKLVQRSKGKIDWDYLDIKNDCSFPFELLICTYDIGDTKKCDNPNAWGTTDRANPGSKIFTISTSKTPNYKIKFFTCDMTGVKNNSKLCLNPLRKRG